MLPKDTSLGGLWSCDSATTLIVANPISKPTLIFPIGSNLIVTIKNLKIQKGIYCNPLKYCRNLAGVKTTILKSSAILSILKSRILYEIRNLALAFLEPARI